MKELNINELKAVSGGGTCRCEREQSAENMGNTADENGCRSKCCDGWWYWYRYNGVRSDC